VFAQTYKDFDIIILDSGSTDETLSYIASLNDTRVKIYTTDKRLNIEENWSRIKNIPRSEFMSILGHDDILYPDFLETINQLIVAHPQATVYHTHYNFIDAKGEIVRKCASMKSGYDDAALLSAFLTADIEMMATGYVVRSADYDRVGGVPAFPGLLYADFALWLALTKNSLFVVAPKTSFAFRIHQTVTSTSADQKIQTGFKLLLAFLRGYTESSSSLNEIKQKHGPVFLERYIKSHAHRLLRTRLQNRQNSTVRKFIINAKIEYAYLLGLSSPLHPEKKWSVKIAIFIDDFSITRNLFMLFRKSIKKPLVK